MPKLWLPPAVWFQGSQSQSTGGSSARNGSTLRIIAWLDESMRWVLITPFGRPVEPEVNRILATLSGRTRARASSTAPVSGVSASAANGVASRPIGADDDTTSSVPKGSTARSAGSYSAPSAAKTRRGSTSATISRRAA